MLIIQEKSLMTNKTIFLFSNLCDIIKEFDEDINLYKIKILESKLYDE